jgi:hypothetical protein
MNSTALSVAYFPMLSSTRHVIDNIYAGFSEVVMAGRMVGLWGNLLLNFRAETLPITEEKSSPINNYKYYLLVPTDAPIVLIYISPYGAATCFGWSPSSVQGKNNVTYIKISPYNRPPTA